MFQDENLEFSLVDSNLESEIGGNQLRINRSTRELTYDRFGDLGAAIYYWKLPSEFLGNKVIHLIEKSVFNRNISDYFIRRISGVHFALCS